MIRPSGLPIDVDPADVKDREGWGYKIAPDPDHNDGFHKGGPEESKSVNVHGVPDHNADLMDEIAEHNVKKKKKKKKSKSGSK